MKNSNWERQRELTARRTIPFAPNAITIGRLSASVALSGLAIRKRKGWRALGLGGSALIVQWVGDTLDGAVARRLDQETVFGAWNDCLSDRIAVGLGCAAISILEEDPIVAAFGLHYVVLDGIVSMAFTRFGLASPNYFYLVDKDIYRLNWSNPAKLCSQLPLVASALKLPRRMTAALLAAVMIWKTTTLILIFRRARRGPAELGVHEAEEYR